MKQLQQGHARQAAETVATAPNLIVFIVDRHIVPIGKSVTDALIGLGIMREEFVERVVGEDDTEAESVVIAILLDDFDVPLRFRLLGEKGEIEAARAAANHLDPHHSASGPAISPDPL